jgi:hypothetical protein
VLEGDKNNVKARFRLAKALVGTNDLEEAKRELEQVSPHLTIVAHSPVEVTRRAFLQMGCWGRRMGEWGWWYL